MKFKNSEKLDRTLLLTMVVEALLFLTSRLNPNCWNNFANSSASVPYIGTDSTSSWYDSKSLKDLGSSSSKGLRDLLNPAKQKSYEISFDFWFKINKHTAILKKLWIFTFINPIFTFGIWSLIKIQNWKGGNWCGNWHTNKK